MQRCIDGLTCDETFVVRAQFIFNRGTFHTDKSKIDYRLQNTNKMHMVVTTRIMNEQRQCVSTDRM